MLQPHPLDIIITIITNVVRINTSSLKKKKSYLVTEDAHNICV